MLSCALRPASTLYNRMRSATALAVCTCTASSQRVLQTKAEQGDQAASVHTGGAYSGYTRGAETENWGQGNGPAIPIGGAGGVTRVLFSRCAHCRSNSGRAMGDQVHRGWAAVVSRHSATAATCSGRQAAQLVSRRAMVWRGKRLEDRNKFANQATAQERGHSPQMPTHPQRQSTAFACRNTL